VTTYDAANIGTHAATLKGSVNPSGLDTMYYFEFGETASYGTKKSQVYAGKGTDPTPVSLDLPNSFTPGKLYHYRIVASNTMGVSYGEDKTFTAEKLNRSIRRNRKRNGYNPQRRDTQRRRQSA